MSAGSRIIGWLSALFVFFLARRHAWREAMDRLLRWGLPPMLALLAFGCVDDQSPDDPAINSESHWLQACESDAECGQDNLCICNVCSATCSRDNACLHPDGEPTASCVETTERPLVQQCDAAGPPAASICLAACLTDADCPTEGSRCITGACVNPLGCQDDTFWDLAPSTFPYEGGDVPLYLEFIEGGDPGELAARLCTVDGSPLEGTRKLIIAGLGLWDGTTFHDFDNTALVPGELCSPWGGIPSPSPTVQPGEVFGGYSLEVNPAGCESDYGYSCAPMVDNPCGVCGFTLWSVTRGCRP